MGTTKIKIIDLSSENQEVKASQKHAQSLGSATKLKKESQKPQKEQKVVEPENLIVEKSEESESQVAEESESSKKPKVAAKKAKTSKATKKHHLGKKYKEAAEKIEKNKVYPFAEAFELISKTSYTKFDPTIEIHLSVNAKSLRGNVNLPHATGPQKEKTYLVFSDKKTDIKNAIWASEETIAEIESGKLKPNRDFSSVIANPKFMPSLARVAKILGPAGMMPNPKNGTITETPQSAIDASTTTGTEYRTDPMTPVIHFKLGKLSKKPEEIKENLKALVNTVGSTKIKKATINSTMGPGIKIDILSL